MEVNFYLEQPQSDKPTRILMYCSFEGKRLKYPTGKKILPKHWHIEQQEVKRGVTERAEIKDKLDNLRGKVNEFYVKADTAGIERTPEFFREKLNEFYYKTKKDKLDFCHCFEQWKETRKITDSPSMVKTYTSTLNHLKEFEKTTHYHLSFDNMTITFYEKFVKYFIETLKRSNNTVGKYVKRLKMFLKYAHENGLMVRTDFLKFKVFNEEPDLIYLTEEELQLIEGLDLSLNSRLAKVRDVFLLQCYTGLRYGDIARLKPENIRNGFIRVQTQKTKEIVSIPITPYATNILLRYSDLILPVISNQRMNEYLKEIAALAKITEPTVRTLYRGTERIDTTLPKHKFVCTHTGRRTFITLSLEKGIRPESLMKITGHKDIKTFSRYVKITERIAAQELKRAWSTFPEPALN